MNHKTPSISFQAGEDGPSWVMETDHARLRLDYNNNGLSLTSFSRLDQEYGLRLVAAHPAFFFRFAGNRHIAGNWTFQSWTQFHRERAVQLDIVSTVHLDGVPLLVTASVWVAHDLPVLRVWTTLSNDSPATVGIVRYHVIDLAIDHDVAFAPVELFGVDAFAGHRKDSWDPGDGNYAPWERAIHPSDAFRLTMGAYQSQCSWVAVSRDNLGLAIGLEYDGAAELRVFDTPRTPGAVNWGVHPGAERGVRLLAAPIDALNVHILPGESWTSPAAFIALFDDGWDGAAQVTHALVERHLAPPLPDEQFPYVIFNSWGYAFDLDPTSLIRCLDIAAEIGVEVFVADYGWMRDVGDWVSVGDRIPPLAELREMVASRGMKLGAWIGFGNAGPDTPVLTEHPDWRAYPDDWGSFRSRALCLAEPAVRDWAIAEVNRAVDEYGLDYILHDFELISPCRHPEHHHPPDPSGYHSAMGYNEVLRQVRAAHPSLVIENCQGGGKMMSYAMVGLHDTSITSDGPVLRDPLSRRQALFGATYPFPLRFCDNYMEERPTDLACHSSMIGGPWILMDRATDWSDLDRTTAKQNIALYKKIRPWFHDARVYHLRRADSVVGFYGASSMERLPVERAITETTRQFKAMSIRGNAS